jgi:hypothetical protein
MTAKKMKPKVDISNTLPKSANHGTGAKTLEVSIKRRKSRAKYPIFLFTTMRDRSYIFDTKNMRAIIAVPKMK